LVKNNWDQIVVIGLEQKSYSEALNIKESIHEILLHINSCHNYQSYSEFKRIKQYLIGQYSSTFNPYQKSAEFDDANF